MNAYHCATHIAWTVEVPWAAQGMHEYLGIAIKWILAAVVHTKPVVKQQTGQRQQVAKVYCMLQKVSSVSEDVSV